MTRHSFLFTHWEGGGNTPPVFALVRRLLARGHRVHVLSDICHRQEVEALGASFGAWTGVPPRPDKSAQHDPMRDYEAKSPIDLLRRLRDKMFVGPAGAYARDVLDTLQRVDADVIVTSEMQLGAMAAAESAHLPCVVLSPNIYLLPRPGAPPFGPGFQPLGGPIGAVRDWMVRTMLIKTFAKGTAQYNAYRRDLGLAPLSHPLDQFTRVTRHLVMTSPAFDFAPETVPPHVVYTGPILDDPDWAEPWRSSWPATDTRPLVLVGFSTTFQNQVEVLGRVIAALGALPVRAVVTVGPGLGTASFPEAPNVHLCASAPHSEILRQASLTITHAGHGTVMRALAAGVPLVCMPMGRDQNDNAARVVARGAGVRVKPNAKVAAIQKAVRTVLGSSSYRANAQALGRRIVDDASRSTAISILEEVAASRPRLENVRAVSSARGAVVDWPLSKQD
jgi:MGT family glycosyltransferase